MGMINRYRHWYWPIRKLQLSVIIGIGRYEKKVIGRPLTLMKHFLEGSAFESYLRGKETLQYLCLDGDLPSKQVNNWALNYVLTYSDSIVYVLIVHSCNDDFFCYNHSN